MYEYDADFLSYTRSIATRSAKAIVPVLQQALHPGSVLDVGCGPGSWLQVWKAHGVSRVLGVDGDYVDPADLAIERSEFRASDLGRPLHLRECFDLVQSLEVAEHLPRSRAKGFVADLCRHGSIVLFGAAPPGQGGEHHINEQPYDYWRRFFDELGYEPFDYVRPRTAHRAQVAPWYRYNTLLYVERAAVESLPESVRETRVSEGVPIPDVSPFLYRIRKQVIRRFPSWTTRALAHVTKKVPR